MRLTSQTADYGRAMAGRPACLWAALCLLRVLVVEPPRRKDRIVILPTGDFVARISSDTLPLIDRDFKAVVHQHFMLVPTLYCARAASFAFEASSELLRYVTPRR